MFTAKGRVHRKDGGKEPVFTAPLLEVFFLGHIVENGKARLIQAPYVEDERNFREGSPCFAWQGPFKYGRPYIKTHGKTLSVLKLIASMMGKKGRVYQLCGHRDCINPDHLGCSHYWKHQKKDEKTRRFA